LFRLGLAYERTMRHRRRGARDGRLVLISLKTARHLRQQCQRFLHPAIGFVCGRCDFHLNFGRDPYQLYRFHVGKRRILDQRVNKAFSEQQRRLSMRVRFNNGGRSWIIDDGNKGGHSSPEIFRRELDGSLCRWRLGSSADDATNIASIARIFHNLGQCRPRNARFSPAQLK
jgi:hypothetical protein